MEKSQILMHGKENQDSFVLQGWNSPGTLFQLRKMESWTYMTDYSCTSTSCFKSSFAFFFPDPFDLKHILSQSENTTAEVMSRSGILSCFELTWLVKTFFANTQMHRVPHALFMQQVITTLNKSIFLYILPDLQLYTYMQRF